MPLPQAGGSQIQLDKETAEQLSSASVDLGEVQSMIAETSAKDEQHMEALKDELTELLEEVDESEQNLLNSIIKQVSEQEKELNQQEKRWENIFEKQEESQTRASAGRGIGKSAPQVEGNHSQPDKVPAAEQEQTSPEDQITGIKKALKTDLVVPFDSAISRLESAGKKDPKETILQKIDRALDPDEIEKQRQEAEKGHSLRREALQASYQSLKEAVSDAAGTLTGALEQVSPLLSKAIPAFKSAVSGIGKVRGKIREASEKKQLGVGHPDQPAGDEEQSQIESPARAAPMLPGASEGEPSAPQGDLIDKQPAAEAGLGGDDGVLSHIASDVSNIFGLMKSDEKGQEIKQLEQPETGLVGEQKEGDPQVDRDAGKSAMDAMSNQTVQLDSSALAETMAGVGAESALDFAREAEDDSGKYLKRINEKVGYILTIMREQATQEAVSRIEGNDKTRVGQDTDKKQRGRRGGSGMTVMGGLGGLMRGAMKALGGLAKGGLLTLLLGASFTGGFMLGDWLYEKVLPKSAKRSLSEGVGVLVESVKSLGTWVADLYDTWVRELSMLMSDPWGTLKRWIIGTAEGSISLAAQASKLASNIGSLALDMFTTLGEWIFGEKLFATMQKKMSKYIGNVIAGFKSVGSFLMDPVASLTSLIFGDEAAKKFKNTRSSIMQSLMDGFTALANYVKNPEELAKSLLGIGNDEKSDKEKEHEEAVAKEKKEKAKELRPTITEQARKGELSDKRFETIKEAAAKNKGGLTVEGVKSARGAGIRQRQQNKVKGAGEGEQIKRSEEMKNTTEREIRAREQQQAKGGAGQGNQQNTAVVNSPSNSNTLNVFGGNDMDRSARRHQDSIAPMGTP